ncbi:MAG: ABC transporter ATP-binding protein [Gammaproteobacteria bacterium]|nr:ABC transporter ATP-binding protein [Gammaproteobacteria bacterium]
MNALVSARSLKKRYGGSEVLHGIDFDIQPGRIVGLIGPNGAGKTTTLKAILGLTGYEGELSVLGLNPQTQREELMQQVAFIADVAVLPRWLKVSQALDYVAGVHPHFRRAKAEDFLKRTSIKLNAKIGELSKGMVTQLHLALVLAIDAKLLVLDEPTLGLDILFRKAFYQTLLAEYLDENRSILITTHQVEEIQHLLSDLMFIKNGRLVLNSAMDAVTERYTEVLVKPELEAAARELSPLHERAVLGRKVFLFDGQSRESLAQLGELHVPSIADLFVATMGGLPEGVAA